MITREMAEGRILDGVRSRKNKSSSKGIFFSMIAVLLAAVLMTYMMQSNEYERHDIVNIRVNALNSFLDDAEKDIQRAVYISAFRALTTLIDDMIQRGSYSDNVTGNIEELMINGELDGVKKPVMENSTLTEWDRRLSDLAKLIGANFSVSFGSISVNQSSPWTIDIYVDATINLRDQRGMASWHYNKSLHTAVDISGFEDPTFAIETYAKVHRVISKTPYDNFTTLLKTGSSGSSYVYGHVVYVATEAEASALANKSTTILAAEDMSTWQSSLLNQFLGLVSEDFPSNITTAYIKVSDYSGLPSNILLDGDGKKIWNIENLRDHYYHPYYKASPDAPSFLQRLAGNFSSSPYGIESLVDKDEISSAGIAVLNNATNIDYLYWSGTAGDEQIKGMPDSFLLDNEHLDDYDCGSITR